MIHRKFLGMSFHDKRFSFTRKTCLAAAKTIINEVKEVPEESPILWTMQAFSVAAAVSFKLMAVRMKLILQDNSVPGQFQSSSVR